jgi:hypothetical protein
VTRPFFDHSNVSSKFRPAVNKQFTTLKVIIRREALNQFSSSGGQTWECRRPGGMLLRFVKMNNHIIALNNTRLQPGGECVRVGEPFQRLASAGKTVETVLTIWVGSHRAEARC